VRPTPSLVDAIQHCFAVEVGGASVRVCLRCGCIFTADLSAEDGSKFYTRVVETPAWLFVWVDRTHWDVRIARSLVACLSICFGLQMVTMTLVHDFNTRVEVTEEVHFHGQVYRLDCIVTLSGGINSGAYEMG
jgi:hypothetical protein